MADRCIYRYKFLLKHFQRLQLIEKAICIFIVFCFVFPLSLPNWLYVGYKEVDLRTKNQCDFIDGLSLTKENRFIINSENRSGSCNVGVGGNYRNSYCNTSQHVAIVVPYRNRSKHLQTFVQHIHQYLIKQNAINYQLFVIEQDDQLPFNRGNLLNIGFHESLQLYPSLNCFIFHDVDILPLDLRQLYTCSDTPRHLCSYLDKFRYVLIYPNLFGGVIAIKRQQFFLANGYSNLYKGWGGEDDDFFRRIQKRFSMIERYPKQIARCLMINHHQNDVISQDKSQLLKQALSRSQTDGLANLEQTYVRKKIDYHKLYVKIKVLLK